MRNVGIEEPSEVYLSFPPTRHGAEIEHQKHLTNPNPTTYIRHHHLLAFLTYFLVLADLAVCKASKI